jgi:hypothetical protein
VCRSWTRCGSVKIASEVEEAEQSASGGRPKPLSARKTLVGNPEKFRQLAWCDTDMFKEPPLPALSSIRGKGRMWECRKVRCVRLLPGLVCNGLSVTPHQVGAVVSKILTCSLSANSRMTDSVIAGVVLKQPTVQYHLASRGTFGSGHWLGLPGLLHLWRRTAEGRFAALFSS